MPRMAAISWLVQPRLVSRTIWRCRGLNEATRAFMESAIQAPCVKAGEFDHEFLRGESIIADTSRNGQYRDRAAKCVRLAFPDCARPQRQQRPPQPVRSRFATFGHARKPAMSALPLRTPVADCATECFRSGGRG